MVPDVGGRPCKIADMSTSKTGKHGHAKIKMVTYDIFTGNKLEMMSPSTHNVDVPNVTRMDYQVLSYHDGYLTILNGNAEEEDVKMTEGEGSAVIQAKQLEIIEKFENGEQMMATVLKACGEEMVTDWKVMMDTK